MTGLRRLVLVGAGAHAREILEILTSGQSMPTLVGFVSDGPGDDELLEARGVPRLGSVADSATYADEFLLAIGSGSSRRRLAAELQSLVPAEAVVSPRASVASTAAIDRGAVLFPGVTVNADTIIGEHVHVNANSNVSHDCSLGSFATIGPGVTLAGRVSVGEAATVWSGATVLPGVSIGAEAVVGAGAVVISDVEPRTTVVGVPARRVRRR